jgi:hypothetical protein
MSDIPEDKDEWEKFLKSKAEEWAADMVKDEKPLQDVSVSVVRGEKEIHINIFTISFKRSFRAQIWSLTDLRKVLERKEEEVTLLKQVIGEMIETCDICKGKGHHHHYDHSTGEDEIVSCDACGGTGQRSG